MKLSILFPNMNPENYPSSQGQHVVFMCYILLLIGNKRLQEMMGKLS